LTTVGFQDFGQMILIKNLHNKQNISDL